MSEISEIIVADDMVDLARSIADGGAEAAHTLIEVCDRDGHDLRAVLGGIVLSVQHWSYTTVDHALRRVAAVGPEYADMVREAVECAPACVVRRCRDHDVEIHDVDIYDDTHACPIADDVGTLAGCQARASDEYTTMGILVDIDLLVDVGRVRRVHNIAGLEPGDEGEIHYVAVGGRQLYVARRSYALYLARHGLRAVPEPGHDDARRFAEILGCQVAEVERALGLGRDE